MDAAKVFVRLKYPASRPWAWEKLTQGDVLFCALCQLLQRRELPPETMQWVEVCQEEWPVDPRTWNIVRALVWCAEQAAYHPDFYRTEVDRVCFAIGALPDFIERHKTRAWGCIRNFIDTPPWKPSVRVPVALVDKAASTGFIAWFSQEVRDAGHGPIHYAADVFMERDKEFLDSMEDAWAVANTLLRTNGTGDPREGCWRLLKEKNGLNPIPVVSGRSASAAAALGWYHALNGTIPDDRVIVLAQINSQGVLVQVDEKSIPAKVKAIVDYGYFDTIAVAGKADEAVALKALPQGISIRVKNLDSDGIT